MTTAPQMPSSPDSSTPTPPAPPSRPGFGARLWRWTKRLLITGLVCLVLGAITLASGYAYYSQDLPSVDALRNYQPPQVTKVTCGDGTLCAEFAHERRTLIRVEDLPPHVRNAFLAAEDADFYKHEGLDFFGITRAAIKNLIPNSRKSGASTITQQVVKNLLLSPERSFSRKAREWILTPRVEEALTKDQILSLYINQSYYGQRRYGMEEAALFYFGKHAKDLNVGEAAVLAGTVQLPHRINPVTNITRAKSRQRYVLDQMARNGFVSADVAEAEKEKPIVLAPRRGKVVGPYYTEEIRRTLIARYGEQAVMEGGLRVDIAMVPKLQLAAEQSVRDGLEAVDRRQGYRGPRGALEKGQWERYRALIATRIEEAGRRQKDQGYVADLSSLAKVEKEEPKTPEIAGAPLDPLEEEGTEEQRPDLSPEDEAPLSADQLLAQSVRLKPMEEGLRLTGYVMQVDDKRNVARVDLVGRTAEVAFAAASWARQKGKSAPKKISDVFTEGELVFVRVLKAPPAPAFVEAALDQVPEVQGGLVVIRPENRHVVALVGGYDAERSSFNRATQAKRQPGSSFKPFLYAAAMGSGRYTPLSKVNDAPEAVRDPYTGKTWKPQNYDRRFHGPMTLREALTKSKNTVSVRLIEALTPATTIDVARRAGIHSPLPENLTLALGTGEVTMLEAANAYATLQANGRYAEPLLLLRVRDARGKVLEEHQPAFEETLPPAVAYLTTSLMRSVVEDGSGRAVLALERPAAGKTGTTQQSRDTWFSGYTADWVASAWVGFDNNSPLGGSETGGRAALPIWLQFMRVAHEGLPTREFEVPPGVVQVRIDPISGLLAGNSVPGRLEPFLEGTQPTAEAPPPGQVTTDQFFLDEGNRRGL
ncbi:penicillin-binding protein 1A [Myxococcus xanthus]|uniref:penicillin-binding protein 1A n=1 Tax=Myxococcus xanthus TaxID=34 RepID=UPI0003235A8F|nr:PBP1A family penicillin-binding protein [Myxococcus xanthus]QZZ52848.1 Biosynthetic peptidoglycan transglycosylase [Myxococcus xanthus]UYI12545.1 PBP1A family penicillin-binding protein [Myxococcus xanthus]UYI19913.1 PBP1A family penicillin-binding protein [Myxococcus xanthus]SDX57014.1 penicillin-binding protein 1A [Myxococcus xanthus]